MENEMTIIENLKSIVNELMCDEIESNGSLINTIHNIIQYLEDNEDFFIDYDMYDDINDFIDEIKSCISELKCDYADENIIQYLTDALNIIEKDA